jgi:hypothetical protein
LYGYSTVQYSTVQYSTVQYSTVQYSTVQYYCSSACIIRCLNGWAGMSYAWLGCLMLGWAITRHTVSQLNLVQIFLLGNVETETRSK